MNKMNVNELKILKELMAPGIVFGFLASIFLTGTILLMSLVNKLTNNYIVVLGVIASLILGLLIFLNFTRKIRKDLKNKEKETVLKKVISAKVKDDYEPGSGMLYIPILGWLFPKLWGQKMKPIHRYKVQLADETIEISEQEFNLIKDKKQIKVCYANKAVYLWVLNK